MTVAALLWHSTSALAQDAAPFTPVASVNHYMIHQSSPYFSGDAHSWMESSARFGGRYVRGAFSVEGTALALLTSGRDPYGSGSAAAGSAPGTPRPGTEPDLEVDTLYLQHNADSGRITLGRQTIMLGTQFLIGDGAYDGFHRNTTQAVYHNPRRSFDALRLETDTALAHLDAFVYCVHPTWDGGGERNGWFGGAELSWPRSADTRPNAAGLFYRQSHSALDNDMWVATLRGEQRLDSFNGWYGSGEWVGQAGAGRNPSYVTTSGQRLREHAWHAEIGWQDDKRAHKPFAEAGYVYYSDDYTPVAQGFSDWGKWYLGNQIDWIIFGTNTRILRAQAGYWPQPHIKLRAQFHQTRLVSGPGGVLSNEASVIGEWYPNDKLWVNALLGYARPGSALAQSGLGNPFAYLNSGAVPVGNKSSVDLVLAVGWVF